MSTLSPDFYADWRARQLAHGIFQETGPEETPSETFLHQVWNHQRLLRDQIATFDGQPVRVLHPGFWNHESGPDFLRAVIQIGDETPRTGDVEIDLHPSNWHSHGHDRNPAFCGVVLHVVWSGTAPSKAAIPTVALRSKLDAAISDLRTWLGSEASLLPDPVRGQCCAPLRQLQGEPLALLLRQAAQTRLESKAARFEARARQVGWDQALWEGIFIALGYKHNVWPMQRLAEIACALQSAAKQPVGPLAWQARLLGLGGLLPADIALNPGSSRSGFLRGLWDCWWREREALAHLILPKDLWRLNGLRPANHPARRLALAAHWLAQPDLIPRLESWLVEDPPPRRLVSSLAAVVSVEPDPFWRWHWTLRSPKLVRAQPFLGSHRLTDLAVNVLLPWLWVRARLGHNPQLQTKAADRYFAWPRSEDNALLRLARRRLFGGGSVKTTRAADQQALLQIIRDFCQHSNALCDNCQFPRLVQSLA